MSHSLPERGIGCWLWCLTSDILEECICEYGSMRFQLPWRALSCVKTHLPVTYLGLVNCYRQVSHLMCKGTCNRFSVMVKKIVLIIWLWVGSHFHWLLKAGTWQIWLLKALKLFKKKHVWRGHVSLMHIIYFASSVSAGVCTDFVLAPKEATNVGFQTLKAFN